MEKRTPQAIHLRGRKRKRIQFLGEVWKDVEEILKLATSNGDVAQLARALDWQSRGRRFESALLHSLYQALTDKSRCFFLL